MRCQICLALGGYGVDFDEKPLREWQSHAEFHRSQMNDDFDSMKKYFHFCFPQLVSPPPAIIADNLCANAIVKEEIKEEETKVTIQEDL